ncbi:4-alpha-glucanotransferase [Pseudaestuariivita sp.]|uniref:4-alpha-glucanotransferase n=1 Tax=Pseudaestuariivita sp. TaxID=2211669 RepID=UPI00405A3C49
MTTILPSYRDVTGAVRRTTPATRAALAEAMGPATDPSIDWRVCTIGARPEIADPWTLTFEDGGAESGQGLLPPLPLGRHKLSHAGKTTWLLTAPETLPLPPRDWGVIVPLYGLRRAGLATYADLGTVAEAAAEAGAGFLGLNPVHAGFPSDPAMISPYSPSHRRRLNPLFLEAGKAGTGTPLIDYASDVPARMHALRAQFAPNDPAFLTWRAAQDSALERFATYEALAETHGPTWDSWPANTGTPDLDAVTFHAWLQWRAETELTDAQSRATAAGMRFGLYLDLAVGTHPYGAETWEDPDAFARGVSLGAPPDAFSPDGQTWGLAPLNPRHLIETGFAALAETLRAQLRFAGLLRIDHILGFERAFWVPEGGDLPGAYVRMPREAMLAVARIEAARAGATLVGEDLGNVPNGLRAALSTSGLLGCALTMFERTAKGPRRPQHYREGTIASFSTHDLPTFQGWKAGTDLDAWASLGGLKGDALEQARKERRDQLAELAEVMGGNSLQHMKAFLAKTRARLVAVQAEDLLSLTAQPNLPGTITEHPNWRRRLGIDPEGWHRLETLNDTGAIMRAAGRNGAV